MPSCIVSQDGPVASGGRAPCYQMAIAVGKLSVVVACFSVVHGSKVVSKLMAKAVVSKSTALHGNRECHSTAVGVGVGNATTGKVGN